MTGSEAIVEAMRFLRQVHGDVAALMESVDADLVGRGWERTMKGQRISTDLSNGMSPDTWAIRYVSRTYVRKPKRADGRPTNIVAFMVCLQPDDYDHAVALSIGASLQTNLDGEGLWNAWKDVGPLLAYLREHPDGGSLPTKVLQDGFLRDAVQGSAYVAALMEMADMNLVRGRLLDPALKAAG